MSKRNRHRSKSAERRAMHERCEGLRQGAYAHMSGEAKPGLPLRTGPGGFKHSKLSLASPIDEKRAVLKQDRSKFKKAKITLPPMPWDKTTDET